VQISTLDSTAYNAFTKYGRQSPKWCGTHRLNYKALLRAVSIRQQLKKYLDRFGIKTVSCEGDSKRLRRCLVTGYFKVGCSVKEPRMSVLIGGDSSQNAARMMPDGTYRSVRENAVSPIRALYDRPTLTDLEEFSCSTYTHPQYSLREMRQRDGSSFMKSSRPRRVSSGI
jgi:ATP-dependent RNA helicase DDX35